MLFQEAVEKFRRYGMQSYAAQTKAGLRKDLELWNKQLGNMKLQQLTVERLDGLLKTERKPATARRRLASLRIAYSWWMQKKYIRRNPLEKILSASPASYPFLHTGIHRTRHITSADANKLLRAGEAHLPQMEAYPYLLLVFLLSGLRIEEVLALTYHMVRISGDQGWVLVGANRQIPLSYRASIPTVRQAILLVSSLQSLEEKSPIFNCSRTPAQRLLREVSREAGVPVTASAIRWRGIIDHLDHGMSFPLAAMLFDTSQKNLRRQSAFRKR